MPPLCVLHYLVCLGVGAHQLGGCQHQLCQSVRPLGP